MLDLALALVLLVVVVGLVSEVNNIARTLNKPKRGRGRPRKDATQEITKPGWIF